MEDNRKVLYTAFKSKGTRFAGWFFVGVPSTGICCCPICRVKFPKLENCTYYRIAEEN